jgi:hypothetical protein
VETRVIADFRAEAETIEPHARLAESALLTTFHSRAPRRMVRAADSQGPNRIIGRLRG